MSPITNYWPDPRFRDIGKFSMYGCTIVNANGLYVPASQSWPGVTIKTTNTNSTDNWCERVVSLPARARLVIACSSNGDATNTNTSINCWSTANKIAECPLNGGSSDEFTVPPQGLIKVALRAAMHVGNTRTVVNLFIGTKADYEALMRLTGHGFLAGDFMPLA